MKESLLGLRILPVCLEKVELYGDHPELVLSSFTTLSCPYNIRNKYMGISQLAIYTQIKNNDIVFYLAGSYYQLENPFEPPFQTRI